MVPSIFHFIDYFDELLCNKKIRYSIVCTSKIDGFRMTEYAWYAGNVLRHNKERRTQPRKWKSSLTLMPPMGKSASYQGKDGRSQNLPICSTSRINAVHPSIVVDAHSTPVF